MTEFEFAESLRNEQKQDEGRPEQSGEEARAEDAQQPEPQEPVEHPILNPRDEMPTRSEDLRARVLGSDKGIGSAGSSKALGELLAPLRARYPQATDGTLFCVHKLQQDPDLTIPAFRQEAGLYGLKLGGRALHSAKVLLGLAEPAPRKPRSKPEAPAAEAVADRPRRTRARASAAPGSGSLAERIAGVVEEWQTQQGGGESELRSALEHALEIVDNALAAGDDMA